VNQNALAQTLVQGAGSRNPNLRRKVDQLGITLTAYPKIFDKVAVEDRQTLYQALCESIWSLEALGLDAPEA
jgi:hypothetical protein